MFNKILYSSIALLFSVMLFGSSIGNAQTPVTDFNNNKVIHVAQNGDNNDVNDDNDMDWGWIGLIGLAGLLGLRRNDKK
ncbi:WGxxGxxG-CTERM domain-containing protein [Bacillus sp. FJAT-49705]|uniref:WGxxGxxG-CTERM domain-containing protein n=1 Tax=Cytobacillus citreus TaxID=2833586 RepID=A0ABS5NVF2_9BACI|nr:WGxxGxxG family protein [Cytobacillus citreus]MBS4191767.1 WGxxGxxG-CTERM domain-containing protein [Cytobacillus citreus]